MVGDLLSFTVAITLLAASPGPASALVIQQTLTNGRQLAFLSIVGIATGLLTWLIAAMLGLSVLIVSSPVAYQLLRVLGAAFLVFIGVRGLLRAGRRRSSDMPVPELQVRNPGRVRAFHTGLLTCLTNPKVAVFVAAILPQFVPAGHWSVWWIALYAATWMASSSGWYVLLSFLLSKMRWIFERPTVRRRMELVTSVALVAIGLRLAIKTG